MPTLEEHELAGRLERFAPDLLPGQLACRRIFLMPRAVAFMTNQLPQLVSDGYVAGALDPVDQADDFLTGFVTGRSVFQMPPHSMTPIVSGVWELCTPDLRFFGWFWRQGTFVMSAVSRKADVKNRGLYAGYRNQAMQDRVRLDLPPPPFVTGELSDVL